MNPSSNCRTTVVHSLLLVCAFFSGSAGAAVGRTVGQPAVSPVGAAQYSIPIWTPPGVRNIEPHLALVYNSQAGNGLYGQGWTLTGLSAIERCNRSVAQDGDALSPQLDANDRFCVDGVRLRATSGTYGAEATVYQTESADFTQFVSHGAGIAGAGVGPGYFTAKGKDGLYYEFGNSSDSAIAATGSSSVRTWAVNRIYDRNGNSMSFTYVNDTTNGSYRPATITYTSTGSTGPRYSVQFQYQARSTADDEWAYAIGGINNEFNLLDEIIVKSGANVVKIYDLGYDNGPVTSSSRLTSVQECAASTSDCLPATSITYQAGQAGWTALGAAAGGASNFTDALPIDVNGDGLDDLVYPNAGSGTWYYLLGTTSGTYSGPYDTQVPNGTFSAALPFDYDSDGQMDVLVANGTYWTVMKFASAGAPFVQVPTTTPVPAGSASATLGDIDGDGREDLIYGVSGGSGFGSEDDIYYRLNTGAGFSSVENLLISFPNGFNCATCVKLDSAPFGRDFMRFDSRIRKPDFNGDGRRDLIIKTRQCSPEGGPGKCGNASNPILLNFRILLSQASGSYTAIDGWRYGQGATSGGWPLVGDFNGDGCSDLAIVSNSAWKLRFGTCYRSGAFSVLSAEVNTGVLAYTADAIAVDYDGDGRDDIVESNGSTLGFYRSTGATLNAWVNTGIAYPAGSLSLVTDVNGDGSDDFLVGDGSSLPGIYVHSGVHPDLATSIVDGYGNSIGYAYSSTADSSYTRGSGAVFPHQDITPRLQVVTQATATDGTGGSFTSTFTYSGARAHLQGRGFEGFRTRTVTDSRPAAPVQVATYNQSGFPLTGMLDAEDRYQSNGTTLISHIAYTNAVMALDSSAWNQRYFPYVSSTVADQYEVGGPKNGALISTTSTSNTFDSYGNKTNEVVTAQDKDSASPYYGSQWSTTTATVVSPDDSANWCLGLPTQVAITKTAPGVPAITRTVSHTPDYASCRWTASTIEPSSALYWVTQSLGYDSFGNINSLSITGPSLPARTTLTNWGSEGLYPMVVTNPLGQATSYGYDFDRGLRTSVTDPNSLTTAWQFDAFGRRILETRPDGTSTSWGYADCSVAGCLNGNHKLTITETVRNTDGSTQTDRFIYQDRVERPLASSTRQLNGNYVLEQRQYDAFGAWRARQRRAMRVPAQHTGRHLLTTRSIVRCRATGP